MAHRLAWLVSFGVWPKSQIDHISGAKGDNRISNLREATNAENAQAILKPRSNSRSGLRGVTKSNCKFRARICVNGSVVEIGRFDTIEQAGAAYLEAKKKLHPFALSALSAANSEALAPR